jgi:hypothetical protein
LHPPAINVVFEQFAEYGLRVLRPDVVLPDQGNLRTNIIAMMEGAAKMPTLHPQPENAIETYFSATEGMMGQLDLIAEYALSNRAATRPIQFFLRYFPAPYVAALDRLVHPDWYVACFSADPTNASMWGTYGDSHRGVCLKFRTTPNEAGAPSIPLKRVTSLSGDRGENVYGWNFVASEVQQVRYAARHPEIDFFRSLGSVAAIGFTLGGPSTEI